MYKILLFFIIILLGSIFYIFRVKKEDYKKLKNVGLSIMSTPFTPFKNIYDNDIHKYSGHLYSRYKRRYNFLAQRNAGQRQ